MQTGWLREHCQLKPKVDANSGMCECVCMLHVPMCETVRDWYVWGEGGNDGRRTLMRKGEGVSFLRMFTHRIWKV